MHTISAATHEMSSDRPNAPPSENRSSAVSSCVLSEISTSLCTGTPASPPFGYMQIPLTAETKVRKSRHTSHRFEIIQEIRLQILQDRIAENLFGFRAVRIGRKIAVIRLMSSATPSPSSLAPRSSSL